MTSTKICTRVLDHVECICTEVFHRGGGGGGGGGGDLTDQIYMQLSIPVCMIDGTDASCLLGLQHSVVGNLI